MVVVVDPKWEKVEDQPKESPYLNNPVPPRLAFLDNLISGVDPNVDHMWIQCGSSVDLIPAKRGHVCGVWSLCSAQSSRA